jgi:hypothetical protein
MLVVYMRSGSTKRDLLLSINNIRAGTWQSLLDLDHVSASKLNLFPVSESFPIDDLASKQPPTNDTSLRPNKRLSSLFADDLSEDDLHI